MADYQISMWVKKKEAPWPSIIMAQILTFAAMMNLFQSSLLAALPAVENSTLFLSTG